MNPQELQEIVASLNEGDEIEVIYRGNFARNPLGKPGFVVNGLPHFTDEADEIRLVKPGIVSSTGNFPASDGKPSHDPLCPVTKNGGNCCPWMPDCECQCMCDYIAEIRQDTLDKVQRTAVTTQNATYGDPEEILSSRIRYVADALMKEWFKNGHPGQTQEDFRADYENWVEISIADAKAAVAAVDAWVETHEG